MGNEIIFLVEASPEGGYEARALGQSIYTYADTCDELRLMVKDVMVKDVMVKDVMVKDAVNCHFMRQSVLSGSS